MKENHCENLPVPNSLVITFRLSFKRGELCPSSLHDNVFHSVVYLYTQEQVECLWWEWCVHMHAYM